jgi:3D (Asp-Asp-Asp) domain-containing protein
MPLTPTFPERSDISAHYPVRPGAISALIVVLGLSSAAAGAAGSAALRKEVTIAAPGRVVRHTTYRQTVAGALGEAGIVVQPEDEVSPPLGARLREGQVIAVRSAVQLTVIADGETREVRSTAASVAEMLARAGIALSSWDKVYPGRPAPLHSGMRVRVVRVVHTVATEQMAVPYQVRSTVDPRTPRGIVRVVSAGRLGLREGIWRITTEDGRVTARNLIGWRQVRSPLDRVVTVGTQNVAAARGQFAGTEYLDLVATAYSPFCCKGVDDVTAMGIRAGYGVVAVDPRVIPLGSRLYIEGYGYAIAADTGSAIKGMRIDLGYDTKRQALQFGRRPVRVYIIQKGRRRS